MEKWLKLAIEIQSLAQSGLAYTENPYDIERYERLRDISAEMLALKTEMSFEKAKDIFCNESGYQTPKLDTRAAVFKYGKILLVHENNGTWSLPGGWCDVLETIKTNTEKEVLEEAGLNVKATKIIALHDRDKRNPPKFIYSVCKVIVLCELLGGEFVPNIETTEIKYFSLDEIPENLAKEKTTKEQIELCFKAYNDKNWQCEFD